MQYQHFIFPLQLIRNTHPIDQPPPPPPADNSLG